MNAIKTLTLLLAFFYLQGCESESSQSIPEPTEEEKACKQDSDCYPIFLHCIECPDYHSSTNKNHVKEHSLRYRESCELERICEAEPNGEAKCINQLCEITL